MRFAQAAWFGREYQAPKKTTLSLVICFSREMFRSHDSQESCCAVLEIRYQTYLRESPWGLSALGVHLICPAARKGRVPSRLQIVHSM